MGITLPGESPEYRAARDQLLEREIELRGAMEAIAAARRELSPEGRAKLDCVFQEAEANRAPTDVRLSELFAPDKDSLVLYSFMFPRDRSDLTPHPATARRRCCQSPRAHAHRAPVCWTSSRGRPSTRASMSTSRHREDAAPPRADLRSRAGMASAAAAVVRW
jgi:hypothetical protein